MLTLSPPLPPLLLLQFLAEEEAKERAIKAAADGKGSVAGAAVEGKWLPCPMSALGMQRLGIRIATTTVLRLATTDSVGVRLVPSPWPGGAVVSGVVAGTAAFGKRSLSAETCCAHGYFFFLFLLFSFSLFLFLSFSFSSLSTPHQPQPSSPTSLYTMCNVLCQPPNLRCRRATL